MTLGCYVKLSDRSFTTNRLYCRSSSRFTLTCQIQSLIGLMFWTGMHQKQIAQNGQIPWCAVFCHVLVVERAFRYVTLSMGSSKILLRDSIVLGSTTALRILKTASEIQSASLKLQPPHARPQMWLSQPGHEMALE